MNDSRNAHSSALSRFSTGCSCAQPRGAVTVRIELSDRDAAALERYQAIAETPAAEYRRGEG